MGMQQMKNNQGGAPGVQFIQYLRKSKLVIQPATYHRECPGADGRKLITIGSCMSGMADTHRMGDDGNEMSSSGAPDLNRNPSVSHGDRGERK